MDIWGINDPAGKWLVMGVLMVGGYVIFRKSKFMSFMTPAIIFGAGLAMEWIEVWVIILLAMAAGVFFATKIGSKRSDA